MTRRLLLSAALLLTAALVLVCVLYGTLDRTSRNESVVRDGERLPEQVALADSEAGATSAAAVSSASEASDESASRALRDASRRTVPDRAPVVQTSIKVGPVFHPTREELLPLRCAPSCFVRLSGNYPPGELRVRATLPSGAKEMCRTVTFSQMALFLVRTEALGATPGSIGLELLDTNDRVLDAMIVEVGRTGTSEEHRDLIYEVTRHRADLLANAVVVEGILLPVGDPGRRELLRKLGEVREMLLAQLDELRPSTRDRLTSEMKKNFVRIEKDVRRRLAIHD